MSQQSQTVGEVRYSRVEEYSRPVRRERVEQPVGYVGTSQSLEHHRRHWFRPGYLQDLAESYRDFLGTDFKGTVLEVGCGMGHLHQVLGIDRARYSGIDLNKEFVEAGRKEFPGIDLRQGTADKLPSADDSFDCVLCSDVLIHLEDMRPALKEIIRVSRRHVLLRLRTGDPTAMGDKVLYEESRGRLMTRVSIDGRWSYFFYNVLSGEDLRQLLRQAGVTEYRTADVVAPRGPEVGLTKVFFDARQAKARRKEAA